MAKRNYIKPELTLVKLDYSISLQMQSLQPSNPTPKGIGSDRQPQQEPFSSPFGDSKPFG